MTPILFILVILSFFCTYLTLPFWIKKCKQIGLLWKDMNKIHKPENIAGSGGVIVVFGFLLSILLYIAINTFYFNSTGNLIKIFSLITSILIISWIALIDDLFGWQKGGLSKRSRIILVLFSAIPLMVINAGESKMMGIEFGLLFPILIIPIGILGATVTYNFLAGYNGLEASQGIIILSALSIVTYLTGNRWLSLISLCMVSALIAFYIFNKYPAKVFPGDVLTYSVGALIAIIAILGNIEKISVFFFIPYILEFGLKLRGRFEKESFAKVNKEGNLEVPYKKLYSLTHLSIFILKKFKKKVYERDVVLSINAFQILIILFGFLLLL
jgi:UDP-N-acetylglucosamine--dolichyl-phosphate N-acetylglucosaminephosphotransferase